MHQSETEKPIFGQAVQWLAVRDYTVAQMREKLSERFGDVPESVIAQLQARRYLNDERFARNHVRRRRKIGRPAIRQELTARGVPEPLIDQVIAETEWPSLQDAVKAKMVDWNLRAPLPLREASRLFRALARLGYEEDAIREELEQLHEQ